MSNEVSKEKVILPPRFFRKPVKEKVFEKRFLDLLENPKDKEFLASCYEKRDNFYYFTAKIDKAGLKRLKKLAKDIKLNRKWSVQLLPIAALAVIGAGLFVFFTIFMNPLLEKALKNALEGIFEAKTEINAFKLDILRFRIGMNSVIIADRDAPMTNLIETGRIELRLKPNAVLRGKVYIEEISAASLAFGTERKTSGALPGIAAKKEARKKEASPSAPPLVDLSKFDAMAFLDKEMRNLASFALYEDAMAFYTEAAETWGSGAALHSVEAQITELRETVDTLIKFDYARLNIRDPAAVQAAYTLINNAKTVYESANNSIELGKGLVSDIQRDVNKGISIVQAAKGAAESDLARLKSFIDPKSGVHREILEGIIGEMLTDAAYRYIDYGKRLLEALEKVNEIKEQLPKTEKKAVTFKGRDVKFREMRYPAFYLGIFASDWTLGSWHWGFDLRDVSSSPEITARPTTLKLGVDETGGTHKSVNFAGSADFRKSAPNLYSAEVKGKGFPVSVGGVLNNIGIGGFAGDLGFGLSSAGKRNGSFDIGGDVFADKPRVEDAEGTIAKAIAEAVSEKDALNIALRYAHTADGDNNFSLSTNLDSLIMAIIAKIADAYLKEAQSRLESAFREYMAKYASFIPESALDDVLKLARGDVTVLTNLQNEAQNKVAEIEKRIRGAADGIIDEAKAQVGAVVDDAKAKAAEAEANARAQAEAARLQAEAEKKRLENEAAAAAQAARDEAQRRADAEKKRLEEEAKRKAEEAANNAAKGLLNRFGF